MTLGTLEPHKVDALGAAELDYYNYNLVSSREYCAAVVSTRSYQDRLDTLAHVRRAGMGTFCGGIIGMGEARVGRIDLIHTLTILPEHPGSVPIKALVPVAGLPHGDAILSGEAAQIDGIEFARTVAAARIAMPRANHALVRRPRNHIHQSRGARLPRRHKLDLRRRSATQHRQPGVVPGCRHVRDAGAGGCTIPKCLKPVVS